MMQSSLEDQTKLGIAHTKKETKKTRPQTSVDLEVSSDDKDSAGFSPYSQVQNRVTDCYFIPPIGIANETQHAHLPLWEILNIRNSFLYSVLESSCLS